jgi:hypothetical protein
VELAELFRSLAEEVDPAERPPPEWAESDDELVEAIVMVLRTPYLRPEHRRRIHEDLLASSKLILSTRDVHLIDLIVWSEHVETLHKSLRAGTLKTFHFTRALEATCHRCGFELLPLMAEMEGFARDWGARDIARTWERVAPQVRPPAAPEPGTDQPTS